MSQPCISKLELAEFALGKLDYQRSESIATHIDDCSSCQDTIVALAEQNDTFVAGVQASHVAGDDPYRGENALQAGLRRVVSSIRQTSESMLRSSLPRDEQTQIHQIGPYELVGRLGIGGMGAVYKAKHKKLKREVALKVLPRERWPNADVVTRFEREMEAIGQLDHPHIVRASDAGEEEGMHYLVMEYVDGLDLSRLVRRVGSLSAPDACELIRQAAIGLQYAHDNRLIHRDIKPSNLILGWQPSSGASVSAKPTLKILDLGLALLGEEQLQNEHDLTTVGQLMGTLDYMSPEQGLDSHDVDSRSDIFSLGATLFKLLVGKAPLETLSVTTPLKKLTSLATKPLPSIGTIRTDLPAGLVTILDRMLAREPDDRFATAREVAEALQPFCTKANLATLLRRGLAAEENSSAPAVGTVFDRLPQTEVRPKRGDAGFRRLVAWGLAAAVVALGAFIIYLETDKGQIRIKSEVADVDIEVRQGGRVVDTIEVSQAGTGESTRIRAGTYEVILKNAGNDIRLSKDKVTISREDKRPTVTVDRIGQGQVLEKRTAASSAASVSANRNPLKQERAGLTVSVFVNTKKTPIARLRQNIGHDRVSLMADGIAEKDGIKSPATLALAHGCKLLRYQTSGHRVEVGLFVPTDDKAAGNNLDLKQWLIDDLRDNGFEFWLDHLLNRDAMDIVQPQYNSVGSTRADGTEEQVSPLSALDSDRPQTTYDGKTFEQWLAELKVERKAERMIDAVKALHRLHDHGQSELAIIEMLHAMRIYGSYVEDTTPEGSLRTAVRDSLNDMPADQVYKAILRELTLGNAKSRDFLRWFFVAPIHGYSDPVAEYIGQQPDRLGDAVLEVAKSNLPSTRIWAVQTLTALCTMDRTYASRNPEVVNVLRAAVKSDELKSVAGALGRPLALTTLGILAENKPDRETIGLMIETTNDNYPYNRLWAVQNLKKLGPKAAAANQRLIALLRAEFDADYPFMQQGGMGGGGMGGGGMGGGMYYGVGGFGGYPSESPIYNNTSPDIRTEIVKTFVAMGEHAAPAVPGLLKIMERETNILVVDGGAVIGGPTGVVARSMTDMSLKGSPSEQLASDFMAQCFTVIRTCKSKEAIPLLQKYCFHGEYAEALWKPAAKQTLTAVDPSAAVVPGEVDRRPVGTESRAGGETGGDKADNAPEKDADSDEGSEEAVE